MVLCMGVSGTLAYITDTQTSTGNLLAAGTLNLRTNDVDGVTRTLYASSMSPGDTAGPTVITLKNVGTVAGATLDIVSSYSESDDGPNTDPDADAVAALLEVVILNYGGASLLGSISDTNGNGYKDVKELTLPTNFTGLSGLLASESKDFEIAVRLRSDTPNDFQGHGIVVTMTFTLKQ